MDRFGPDEHERDCTAMPYRPVTAPMKPQNAHKGTRPDPSSRSGVGRLTVEPDHNAVVASG